MPVTGRRDLVANRWEPFVHVFYFEGLNLTGASLVAQVRGVRDASGTPLADLSTVGSISTEGITIVSVTTADGVTTSKVSMRLNEATMEAMTAPARPGADFPAWWDMQITPSGGVKYRALEGQFTVHAGVTH